MRTPGIGPGSTAWKAVILPLNYARNKKCDDWCGGKLIPRQKNHTTHFHKIKSRHAVAWRLLGSTGETPRCESALTRSLRFLQPFPLRSQLQEPLLRSPMFPHQDTSYYSKVICPESSAEARASLMEETLNKQGFVMGAPYPMFRNRLPETKIQPVYSKLYCIPLYLFLDSCQPRTKSSSSFAYPLQEPQGGFARALK